MDNCIFCKIISKQIPSEIILENENIFAFKDANPVAPHHILIVPKKHVAMISDYKGEDYNILPDIFTAANQIAARLGLDKKGFRIVVNNGAQAGQAVFHVHFHLIGGRQMTWPPR